MTLVASLLLVLAAGPAMAQGRQNRALDKRQNTAIKKNQRNIKQVRRTVRNVRTVLNAVGATVGTVRGDVTETRAALKAVQDLVPVFGKALTDLSAGLTTVGGGLQRLGSAFGSVEYGAVRLFGRTAGSGAEFRAVEGISANSSDILDDGNGALVTATVPVQSMTDPGRELTLRAAIRSAESDGGATGDPAGQVGAILYAKCASIPGVPATECGGSGSGIDPGQIVCAPQGPPPPQSNFGPLSEQIGSQPLINIQQKAPRSGFQNPTKDDPNPTGGGNCTLPGTGLYEVTFDVQFFDFPTSTTPGPTD